MRTIHQAGAATAVLAALTASASAAINYGDTLTMQYLGNGAGQAVTATVDEGVNSTQVTGGVLQFAVSGHGTVSTFCAQFLQGVSGTNNFDVVDLALVPEGSTSPGPMGEARATLIRDLYARNYATVMSATGSDANSKAAAFAMVLWEITHQDSLATTATGILADLNLSSGNAQFSSASSINTLASNMLAGLGVSGFQSYGVAGLTNATVQDMLIVVPGPAGLAAAFGIAGLRTRRRRG